MKRTKKPNDTESKEMRLIQVVAYPYATTIGTIQVPSNLTNQEKVRKYVSDNFDKVVFEEPELDFRGTDFDVNL